MSVDTAPEVFTSPTVDRRAFEEAVERDFRRNALAGVLYEGTWAIGTSFAILSVLIPSYLTEVMATRTIVGITASLGTILIPLQLFSDRYVGGPNRKRNCCMIYSTCGLIYIAMGLIGALLPAEPKVWRITSFMIGIGLFLGLNNLAGPVYNMLITDNSPVFRRGRLYGYRAVTLGGLGLAGILPARWILDHWQGIDRYHAAIIITGAIFTVSAMCPMLMKDHVDPLRLEAAKSKPKARSIVHETIELLRVLWHAPSYRVFVFFITILITVTCLTSFLITFSRDMLPAGANVNVPLRFQLMFFFASITNGIFIALVADRWGYKLTSVILAVFSTAAFVVVQVFPDHPMEAAMVAYMLMVCASLGMNVCMLNLSVELMPTISPASLFAAGNMIFLIPAVLAPWIAGSILDLARQTSGDPVWGYHVVFTVAATLAALGGVGTVLLVQEPRAGMVYVIKRLERV